MSESSQLQIYIQTIDTSFNMHEEFMKLASLHRTKKGPDIFGAVQEAVADFQKVAYFYYGRATDYV